MKFSSRRLRLLKQYINPAKANQGQSQLLSRHSAEGVYRQHGLP
jgi:hypothetical protein